MAKIGRFYNGRPHTTVLQSIRAIQQMRAPDDLVDALIEVLIATCGRTPVSVAATHRPTGRGC